MKYDSVDDLYDDESAGSGAAPDSNEVGSPDVDSLYDDDETDDKDKGDPAPPDADPPQETEEERTAREEQEAEDARIAGLSDEEREAERVAALSDDEREAERREALTEEERAAEDAEIERRAGLTDEERAAEDEEAAKAAETPTNSVVEKFLEKFGVQGGVIEFEDGNSDHISSFDEETQLGILEEIVQSQQQTMEDKYGLSEVEVDLVNKLRSEDGPTLEDAISSMVSAQVAEREAEVDDIFTKYLKDNAEEGEELTDEDIAAELELVKKSKSYKKNVEAIRKNYISDRESKRKEWQDERKQEFKAAQDNEIQKVVDGVREVADVAGWKVDDKTKNEIIADLVELDENGTSAFTREIISDPKKMFEAQWYMKFGADYFAKMDTYYKGEIEKAKEIGKKEALAKKKAAPKVSATKKGGKDQKPKGGEKPKTTFSRKPNKVDSVDELYN
jgi:hypothetical protein